MKHWITMIFIIAIVSLASIQAELILYWSMNEGSGSILSDGSNSTTSYTGSLTNMDSSAWVQGRSGYGLNFDGTNDYVINDKGEILGSELFGTGHNGTITTSIWFYARRGGVIVDEVNASRNWHDSQIEILDTGEVRVRVWAMNSVSLGTASLNNWHHVVLRYNGSTSTLDGFLDGQEAVSDVVQERNNNPYGYSGHAYYPLGLTDTTNLGDGRYFSGMLDEFRIYNHALSSTEINQLYQNPSGVVPEASAFLFVALGLTLYILGKKALWI